jgi:MFS family permease
LLFSRGFVNVGFFTLVGFLAFFVRESLGVAGAAIQTQTALLFLTFTVSAVPGAILAARPTDRADKRLVVTVACVAVAAALAMLAGAHLLAAAYAAAAFAGVGWGAFITADYALAAAVLPPNAMATGMGIWNLATTIPQILAPIAAAPIILYYDRAAPGLGPRAAILVALAEYLIGAAVIWRLPRV